MSETYISLYRKWRSQSLDEIIGQDFAVQTLKNSLKIRRLLMPIFFVGQEALAKPASRGFLQSQSIAKKTASAQNPARSVTAAGGLQTAQASMYLKSMQPPTGELMTFASSATRSSSRPSSPDSRCTS